MPVFASMHVSEEVVEGCWTSVSVLFPVTRSLTEAEAHHLGQDCWPWSTLPLPLSSGVIAV